eukprot:6478932-Amphidinium_carterae.2
MDLRHALGQIAVPFCYVAMTVHQFMVLDRDMDTIRGMHVQHLFSKAAEYVGDKCDVAQVAFMVMMYEAHHLICVLKPGEDVGLARIANMVCRAINQYFEADRQGPEDVGQKIAFMVDPDKCILVLGGMYAAPDEPCVGSTDSAYGQQFPDEHLYKSAADGVDPVNDCIAWLLLKRGDKIRDRTDFGEYMRVVVRRWLFSACKQGWSVAALRIPTLAASWNVDEDECITRICSPKAHSLLATLYVYAVACVIQLDVAVLDDNNERVDGYVRAQGFGLKREGAYWIVMPPLAKIYQCCDVSTTIPHADDSQEFDSVLEVLPFTGYTQDSASSHCYVEGGAKGLWERSAYAFRRAKQEAMMKTITISSGKARPVSLRFSRLISTRRIILEYAKTKRVGRDHLSLVLPCVRGVRTVNVHSPPILLGQDGYTLVMKNNSYANNSRLARKERVESEELNQFLVDNVKIDEGYFCRDPRSDEVPLDEHGKSLGANVQRGFLDERPESVRFLCEAFVPSNLSLEHALKVVRRAFHLQYCTLQIRGGVLEVKVSPDLCKKETIPGVAPDLVTGAGRCRVQADAVASNAKVLVTADLKAYQQDWDEKLIGHVMHHDKKCTLACFQAQSRVQRMQALCAALQRMGLMEYAQRLKHQIQSDVGSAALTREGEERPTEPPTIWSTALDTDVQDPLIEGGNIALRQGEQKTSSHVSSPLISRVEALETWAHALDSVSCDDDARSSQSLCRASELIAAVFERTAADLAKDRQDCAVEQLKRQALQIEQLTATVQELVEQNIRGTTHTQEMQGGLAHDFEKHLTNCEQQAVAKALQALPATAQGLCVEHSLILEVLRGDIVLARRIMQTENLSQTYHILGQALISSGNEVVGRGMLTAVETLAGNRMAAQEGDMRDNTTNMRDKTNARSVKSEEDACEGGAVEEVRAAHTDSEVAGASKRKRGRPPGPVTMARRAAGEDLISLTTQVRALADHIKRLEESRVETQQASAPSAHSATTDRRQQGEGSDCVALRQTIEQMDKWLAELGESTLRTEVSLKQIRGAVGLPEVPPAEEPNQSSVQDVNLSLTMQLMESRIIAMEQLVRTDIREAGGSTQQRDVTARVSACEQKLINIAAAMERFARAIQANWNGMQGMAQKLQITHDAASLALRCTTAGGMPSSHINPS